MYGEQRVSAEKRRQPEMDTDGQDFEEGVAFRQSHRPVDIVHSSKTHDNNSSIPPHTER